MQYNRQHPRMQYNRQHPSMQYNRQHPACNTTANIPACNTTANIPACNAFGAIRVYGRDRPAPSVIPRAQRRGSEGVSLLPFHRISVSGETGLASVQRRDDAGRISPQRRRGETSTLYSASCHSTSAAASPLPRTCASKSETYKRSWMIRYVSNSVSA